VNGLDGGYLALMLGVATVLLAVVLDGLVVLAGRVLMPWTRRERATARADREGV